jgi:hypothetical protein
LPTKARRLSAAAELFHVSSCKLLHFNFHPLLGSALAQSGLITFFGKKTRKVRLVAAFNICRACRPELPEGGSLAAAWSRTRCVFLDGCPVESVHRALGGAPHIGQRTNNMRPNESFSVCEAGRVTTAVRVEGEGFKEHHVRPVWPVPRSAHGLRQRADSSRMPPECGGCRSGC